MLEVLGAVVVTVLPRRHWSRFSAWPLHSVAPVSGLLTLLAGAAMGVSGFFAYLERMSGSAAGSILEVSRLQVEGQLPESVVVSAAPLVVWTVAPIAFAFFTPLGLASLYLVGSGWFRIAGWWVSSPHGDPLLTAADTLIHWRRQASISKAERQTRERAEGADEPDRRYSGAWAGLPEVEFVIVAARRKPEWTAGTFVVTPDGWFTLGEPCDRPMPQGLRTVYPLIRPRAMDVMRRSVSYELPPLRPHAARARHAPAEPSRPPGES